MTEEEWLTGRDPEPMLWYLRQHQASDRKLRLFAVACARRSRELLPTDRERIVLDVAVHMADGRTLEQDRRMAQARVGFGPIAALLGPAVDAAHEIARFVAAARGRNMASAASRAEQAVQADLLREVFGNPIRAVPLDPRWWEWNQGFIRQLAQGIYEDHTFHRLPILADALEDAGCTDAVILNHLRGPGNHVRGCWCVDLLLANE